MLGWIRSAVAFIKVPARPRQDRPQPDTVREVDEPSVTDVAGSDTVELEPKPPISIAPASPAGPQPVDLTSIEPETRSNVAPASPTIAEPETRIGVEPERSSNPEEIDRRRAMVRAFFNDYWSSIEDKPASFADRLDGAEGYINERVAAGGEVWRLDPATRKQLGLPPSKKA
jgi:hypothetical protein